jgi:hypothetical protein
LWKETQNLPKKVDKMDPVFAALKAAPAMDDAAIRRLAKYLDLRDEDCEVKAYSDCAYVNYRRSGVSLCFDKIVDANQQTSGNLRLGAVHLYNQLNTSKFEPISATIQLPFALTRTTSIRDLVVRFAPVEPEKGGGDRSQMNIWIRYPQHGILAEFPSRSWDLPEGTPYCD